jgi:hypothetical protein
MITVSRMVVDLFWSEHKPVTTAKLHRNCRTIGEINIEKNAVVFTSVLLRLLELPDGLEAKNKIQHGVTSLAMTYFHNFEALP